MDDLDIARFLKQVGARGILISKHDGIQIEQKDNIVEISNDVCFTLPDIPDSTETFEFCNIDHYNKFQISKRKAGKCLAVRLFKKLKKFIRNKKSEVKKLQKKTEYHEFIDWKDEILEEYVTIPIVSCSFIESSQFSKPVLEKLTKLENTLISKGKGNMYTESCKTFFNSFGSHFYIGMYYIGGSYTWLKTKSSKNVGVISSNSDISSQIYVKSGGDELFESKNRFTIDDFGLWKQQLLSDPSSWQLLERDMDEKNLQGVWTLVILNSSQFKEPYKFSDSLEEAWNKINGNISIENILDAEVKDTIGTIANEFQKAVDKAKEIDRYEEKHGKHSWKRVNVGVRGIDNFKDKVNSAILTEAKGPNASVHIEFKKWKNESDEEKRQLGRKSRKEQGRNEPLPPTPGKETKHDNQEKQKVESKSTEQLEVNKAESSRTQPTTPVTRPEKQEKLKVVNNLPDEKRSTQAETSKLKPTTPVTRPEKQEEPSKVVNNLPDQSRKTHAETSRTQPITTATRPEIHEKPKVVNNLPDAKRKTIAETSKLQPTTPVTRPEKQEEPSKVVNNLPDESRKTHAETSRLQLATPVSGPKKQEEPKVVNNLPDQSRKTLAEISMTQPTTPVTRSEKQEEPSKVVNNLPDQSRKTYDNLTTKEDTYQPYTSQTSLFKKEDALVIVAIDIGNTYSRFAFTFRHGYDKIYGYKQGRVDLLTENIPTAILFDGNGSFLHFGWEAEQKYDTLLKGGNGIQYFYFTKLKKNLLRLKQTKDWILEDITGKSMPAIKVFSETIRFLKDQFETSSNISHSNFKNEEIHWVLTIPPFWMSNDKQFMREAAHQAGIKNEMLSLVSEPEAAVFYYKEAWRTESWSDISTYHSNEPTNNLMVVDCGGETIDITSYEIQNDSHLKEIGKPSGGPWGGTCVDQEHIKFLQALFGSDVWEEFERDAPEDARKIRRTFETKKKTISQNNTERVTISYPVSLYEYYSKINNVKNFGNTLKASRFSKAVTIRNEKLRYSPEIIEGFFSKSINSITTKVKELLNSARKNGNKIDALMIVGGYSFSPILKERMQNEFQDLKIISFDDAAMVVVKGAVLFGRLLVTEENCTRTWSDELKETTVENKLHEEENETHADILRLQSTTSVTEAEKQEETKVVNKLLDEKRNINIETSRERPRSTVARPEKQEEPKVLNNLFHEKEKIYTETLKTRPTTPVTRPEEKKEPKVVSNLPDSCLTRKGGNNVTSKYEFKFDRVFSDQSSQHEVFDEISQLVQTETLKMRPKSPIAMPERQEEPKAVNNLTDERRKIHTETLKTRPTTPVTRPEEKKEPKFVSNLPDTETLKMRPKSPIAMPEKQEEPKAVNNLTDERRKIHTETLKTRPTTPVTRPEEKKEPKVVSNLPDTETSRERPRSTVVRPEKQEEPKTLNNLFDEKEKIYTETLRTRPTTPVTRPEDNKESKVVNNLPDTETSRKRPESPVDRPEKQEEPQVLNHLFDERMKIYTEMLRERLRSTVARPEKQEEPKVLHLFDELFQALVLDNTETLKTRPTTPVTRPEEKKEPKVVSNLSDTETASSRPTTPVTRPEKQGEPSKIVNNFPEERRKSHTPPSITVTGPEVKPKVVNSLTKERRNTHRGTKLGHPPVLETNVERQDEQKTSYLRPKKWELKRAQSPVTCRMAEPEQRRESQAEPPRLQNQVTEKPKEQNVTNEEPDKCNKNKDHYSPTEEKYKPRPSKSILFQNEGDFVVVAIDIGNTYSGYAYSFRADHVNIYSNKTWHSGDGLITERTPTAILFDANGSFRCFGYEAEQEHATLSNKENRIDYFYFTRFKMDISNSIRLLGNKTKDMILEDIRGQPMSALKVLSESIRYLKNHFETSIRGSSFNINLKDEDIHWVLTIPTFWADNDKQFMREAANKAGIKDEKLSLVSEAEAAAIYCEKDLVEKNAAAERCSLESFVPGQKLIVLDCGGTTTNISRLEVQNGSQLKAIGRNSEVFGGACVDQEHIDFLQELFGRGVWRSFERNFPEEALEIRREFEARKRGTTPKMTKLTMKYPLLLYKTYYKKTRETFGKSLRRSRFSRSVTQSNDKLRYNPEIIEKFFSWSINSITVNVKKLLDFEKREGYKIGAILMVGGYSDSPILQERVRNEFQDLNIICPKDAVLAVVKGAVMFGHKLNKEGICPMTFGIIINLPYRELTDTEVLLTKGAPILYGKRIIPYGIKRGQRKVCFEVFASDSIDPSIDEKRQYINEISVHIPPFVKPGTLWKMSIEMKFEYDNLIVIVSDNKTGEQLYNGVM